MFKVGDRVRSKINGEINTVKRIPGMDSYDRCHYLSAEEGFELENDRWEHQSNWELSFMFKVGDKVKCVEAYNDRIIPGLKGVIVNINYPGSIGIEWEKDINGHDCNGYCKNYYGYYVSKSNIELLTSSDEPNKRRTIRMKLNLMMKRLLDADTKKLIEGGMIDGDLQLTPRGERNLTLLLFDEKKAELVKIAEKFIEDEKENK